MNHRRYSLHLGCGESLTPRYPSTQNTAVDKKRTAKKTVKKRTNQVTESKRK